MLDNIGGEIKCLAQSPARVGIIASVVMGSITWLRAIMTKPDEMLIMPGPAEMIGGSLLSWICCFSVYGYGELIGKTTSIEARRPGQSLSPRRAHRPSPVTATSVPSAADPPVPRKQEIAVDNAGSLLYNRDNSDIIRYKRENRVFPEVCGSERRPSDGE